jgi:hypothetical protein
MNLIRVLLPESQEQESSSGGVSTCSQAKPRVFRYYLVQVPYDKTYAHHLINDTKFRGTWSSNTK